LRPFKSLVIDLKASGNEAARQNLEAVPD
jgi:hypothetical protein